MRRAFELIVMVVAACLEVGGDALIRKGFRGGGAWLIACGFGVIGAYGLAVNWLDLDFSALLGAYVGVFALVSVLAGRWLFGEQVATTTWIGLVVIVLGALIVHVGALR